MSHDRYEDFETGEPPAAGHRPVYAEHMNTLAQSGVHLEKPYDGPHASRPHHRGARGPRLYPPGLLRSELDEARRIWARLPRWSDLVRGAA